jgi:ATP-dependent protease ClpP protease subunit
MKNAKYYEIRNATTQSADIYIYEQIGEDWWTGAGVTAKAFVKDLKALGNADINLHINSAGGSVFEASAIYTALKTHAGKVTAYIDGLAASAASFVALAADTVVMADNALFMIHNPWGGAQGNAKDLRDMADLLDKVRDTMMGIYMSKTSLTEAELLAALDAETWYSASEAMAAGFCDCVGEPALAAASFDREPLRAFGYRNIPAQLTPTDTEQEMKDKPAVAAAEVAANAAAESVADVRAEVKLESPAASGQPLMYTNPRSPIMSAGSYLEHTMRAALGNKDSAAYIQAADDSLTTNPAFDQKTYISKVIDPSTKFGRPTIDAFGGTIPSTFQGKTVEVPRVTGNTTVAETAEAAAASETGMTSDFVSGTVKKYSGMQTFSQETLDLSGSPIFYDTMLKNLMAAYLKQTNEAVIATCVASGTAGAAQAASAAGLIAFHSVETAAAYLATGEYAESFIAGTSIWSLTMGATDSTGRPLFNAFDGKENTAGSVGGRSSRGKFLDLDFYADRGMVATSIDDSALIVVPSALMLLEQAPQKLQVAQLAAGQYEVSLHGYLCQIVQIAAGIRRFNLT